MAISLSLFADEEQFYWFADIFPIWDFPAIYRMVKLLFISIGCDDPVVTSASFSVLTVNEPKKRGAHTAQARTSAKILGNIWLSYS
jgi:hypothetical protein